ncbi:major facilitator superfamily domain-containing protein [Xylariales sp. PMI_506]|nr:major facilitator superfamily domain-containing protein [Xylariales sp. PMI_506]
MAEEKSKPPQVGWDGPEDPKNPRNWPVRRRAYQVGVVMFVVITTSTASSAIAPAVPQILQEFGSSNTLLGTLCVSIELLGLGFGPLFLGPMSEMYGRRIVYMSCNLVFCMMSVACALAPTLNSLVAFRFLQGLSSGSSSNGGGTISDLVPVRRRGAVISIYAGALLFGPTLGPIFGASLADSRGWRWVFWLIVILNGTAALTYALTCRETYAPVLLRWKAQKLRTETNNPELRALGQPRQPIPLTKLLLRAVSRPTRMLIFSPIVTALSLYVATTYGIVYLLFSTFSFVFEDQYHFQESQRSYIYLGLAIGMLVSLAIAGFACDSMYNHLVRKNGVEKPEYRLTSLIYGAIATPIGLLIYGWTAHFLVHPVVPIIGTAFVGFGTTFTYIPIQLYLIDAFTKYAASASAASSVLRALAGSLLPLAGLPMYDKLGLGWGNTLLALIALGLAALPAQFIRFGERWRQKFAVDLEA